MNKFLFSVTAIATISLLAPGTGFAEPTHPNEVGLYMNDDGTGATGTDVLYTLLTVYLVLTRPTDTATGTPYAYINGFELALNFNTGLGNGLFLLPEELGGTNSLTHDFDQGILEYSVFIFTYWPVTDDSVWLITFTFLHLVPETIEVTLGPNSEPSITGQMAFRSGLNYTPVAMYPISGSPDAPVFLFGGEAVAVENESFGSVKALYR